MTRCRFCPRRLGRGELRYRVEYHTPQDLSTSAGKVVGWVCPRCWGAVEKTFTEVRTHVKM